jgi:hypothetical protein
MKKRLSRGVLVAAVILGGLLVSAGLTAPAQAKIAPASTSSHGGGHQTVQPNGGCAWGFICGAVYNSSNNWVLVSDDWCGYQCGNIVQIPPQSWSPFADTDSVKPFPGCTASVDLVTPDGRFTYTITDALKVPDGLIGEVTAEWC